MRFSVPQNLMANDDGLTDWSWTTRCQSDTRHSQKSTFSFPTTFSSLDVIESPSCCASPRFPRLSRSVRRRVSVANTQIRRAKSCNKVSPASDAPSTNVKQEKCRTLDSKWVDSTKKTGRGLPGVFPIPLLSARRSRGFVAIARRLVVAPFDIQASTPTQYDTTNIKPVAPLWDSRFDIILSGSRSYSRASTGIRFCESVSTEYPSRTRQTYNKANAWPFLWQSS